MVFGFTVSTYSQDRVKDQDTLSIKVEREVKTVDLEQEYTQSEVQQAFSSQTGYITYNNSTYDFHNSYISPSHKSILNFNEKETLETAFRYGFEEDNGNRSLSDENAVALSPSMYDEKGRQIYKNFETNEVVMRNKKALAFDAYIVDDHWTKINWEINDDFKEILGYKVRKAIGNYRGRTYTVWYAPELSYPYGPWKMSGLPGVILEYSDGNHNYGTATEICYPCEPLETIEKPQEENVRTIEEHVKITDNIHIYSILELRKKGMDNFIVNSKFNEKELLERREKSREYLYEWEGEDTKRGEYDKKILRQVYELGPSAKKRLQKLKEEKEKSDNDFNTRTFRD